MSENILHFNKKRNYQRIRKDKVVRLKYLLTDRDTKETLAFRDDMVYLHGGYGSAFPKVEEALQDLEVDMKADVSLEAADAYGDSDPALLMEVPLNAIPEEGRHLGAEIAGERPDGSEQSFRVVEVTEEHIKLDGNHPLAGRRLRFQFEVLDIRDATAEEIKAGYGFPNLFE